MITSQQQQVFIIFIKKKNQSLFRPKLTTYYSYLYWSHWTPITTMLQRTFSDVEELTELDSEFYNNLISLEEQHSKNPSPDTFDFLIRHYTDCIYYHEQIDEPVSGYFQFKLKKLIQQPRENAKKKDLTQRKNKLLLQSVRLSNEQTSSEIKPGHKNARSPDLQSHLKDYSPPESNKANREDEFYQPVVDAASREIDTVDSYHQKITNILDNQKQQLLKRRRNLRKCLTKSASVAVSMDSLFDSPQHGRDKSTAKSINKMHLFQSLIDANQELQ